MYIYLEDRHYGRSIVDRYVKVNRAVLVGFCGLLATTPAWADPPQDGQFQDDQLQPEPKKRVVHHHEALCGGRARHPVDQWLIEGERMR